jgi:transcription initiation factor TFIIH subunit 2
MSAQQNGSSSTSNGNDKPNIDLIAHDDDMIDEDDIYGYNRHKSEEGKGGYIWEQKYLGNWDLLNADAVSEEERIQQLHRLQLQEQRRKRARVAQNKNFPTNASQYLTQYAEKARMEEEAMINSGAQLPSAGDQSAISIIRKGIIRYLYLILDMSEGVMTPMEHGKKTARMNVVQETCADFIREYFDQNPLSQMGLIATRNSVADRCSDLTGSVSRLLQALRTQFDFESGIDKTSHERIGLLEKKRAKLMGGEASLQNSLQLASQSLSQIPSYGSKEVLIVYSSLSTCDPGDIFNTIKELKENNIRCSVVSLDAEMYVLKCIAKETNGTLSVPLNEENFKECLFDFASPPPATTKQTRATIPSLIRMGFPQKKGENYFSMCACHNEIRPGGYICPKCRNKYCELPTECKICMLTLVSSPHLARSYHHLFPVKPFIELNNDSLKLITSPAIHEFAKIKQLTCFACMKKLPQESTLRLICLQCTKIYCVECDYFIHNEVHNCPGCDLLA